MIVKLYKSNISIAIILPPIIATILCLPLLIYDQIPVNYNFEWQTYIFEFITKSRVLDFILTLFILIINSVTIVKSFNQTVLFSKTSYLPAIIYLIYISYFPELHFSPTLIVHFLFILLIDQVLKINKTEPAIHISFKSGLIIGLISCFSLYYIPLIFTLFIPLILIRSINIRELTIGILGLSIPLLYLFSQHYVFGDSNIDFESIPKEISEQYQLNEYVKFFILLLITTLGFKMVFTFNKHNTLLSKKQILTITIFSISAIILSLTLFLGFNFIDPIFIIPLIYITSIGTFSSKNDSFISFLLTITLIINIVSIFLK
jgi:hypothetical protein